ncbi:MAG TPA: DEAD/DEAH box helicase [Acidimicrobiales bacterium]|nr:DEAD/DEAH box helicase [Acidimicrobiales bacterium]
MSPTFADLGVPSGLVAAMSRRGITEPFPIQAATIPDALAGRDVCGKAPTGSGKTLAFGLALALRATKSEPRRPRGLVLVPTRELAAQVSTELAPLLAVNGQRSLAIYGGTGYESQRRALRQGVEIVVATPGRLEDLIERRDIRLDAVEVVVLDEADRMADMGFLPAVKRILDAARPDRQTLLFSATLDGEIDVLVKRYQKNPARHAVVTAEEDIADVEHIFWRAAREIRVQLTAHLVDEHKRAIVFCRTKHGADRLAKQLLANGVQAAAIHGDRSQGQRERALAAFRSGAVQALVATDVAARGIHVDAVPCVIHFDPPADHKDYVHRSGRTGRAGLTGTVVTLVGDEHRAAVKTLQRSLGMEQRVETPEGYALVTRVKRAVPPRAPATSVAGRGGAPRARSGGVSRNAGPAGRGVPSGRGTSSGSKRPRRRP